VFNSRSRHAQGIDNGSSIAEGCTFHIAWVLRAPEDVA
jgi:hypothetical protein